MKTYVDAAKLQEYTTKLVAKLKTIFPGTPLVASTVAGMTDHSRTYVYTGSETGYTAGNWYYWDGTAWASGGIYQSSGIETDTTLSVSGKAADGKATGDAIAAAKAAVLAELAPAYSTSGTYAVGDYVIYNSALYRCTTAISTAEAWTAAHWTSVDLAPDLGSQVADLKNAFGDVEYTVENGKYADSTGSISSNGIFDLYSIDVPESTKIKGTCGMTNNGINYIWFYDKDDKPVGEGYRNTESGTYTYNFELSVPAGACNVKISHRNNVSVSFSIEIENQTKGLQNISNIIAKSIENNIIYPDSFTGTDTQKIQACINALAETGGIIIIDRIYTLTGHIFVYTPTDDLVNAENNHRYTTFLGVGKRAGFELGSSYYFSGANGLEGSSFGGLRFYNINFHSNNYYGFVAMHKWIRMVFDNCRFNGFKTAFYSGSLMQNVTCVNCYFTNFSGYVIDLQVTTGQLYAINILHCIVENCKGLIGGDSGATTYWSGVNIENCTIEAIQDKGIIFGSGARGVNIKHNYFENCTNGAIDMGNLFMSSYDGDGINIDGNSFMLTNTAILLPRREPYSSADDMHGVITGNHCGGEIFTEYTLQEPISKYHFVAIGNTASEKIGKLYTPSLS